MVDGYSAEDLNRLASPDCEFIDFMDKLEEVEAATEKGRKDDQDKPDMSLLPFDSLEEVARVLTFGAKKYSRDNWQHVPDAVNRYVAAMLRHLTAWRNGERLDPDSGLSHVSHMACSALFLVWFDMQRDVNGQEQEAGTEAN